MKHCPACETDKSEEAFYPDAKRGDGLSSRCRECHRARMRTYWREKYYPANRDEQIGKVMARRKKERTDA